MNTNLPPIDEIMEKKRYAIVVPFEQSYLFVTNQKEEPVLFESFDDAHDFVVNFSDYEIVPYPLRFSYFLNWMGPLNKRWIDDHGDDWAAGRIDVSGVPFEPYGVEYGVPVMARKDWRALSDFLRGLQTDRLYTREELFEAYGKPINWFK